VKVRVRANKLENATATHISLVERGANRIPFKILKQEKQMINLDLSRIFKQDNAPLTATILGYVLQKEDNTEAVQKALSASGVILKYAKEFEDGTVIYKQSEDVSDEDLKDATIFKTGENLAVVCKGIDAEAMTDGLQAATVVKELGFMPGIDMATNALMTNLNAAFADGKDVVAKAEEALTDFTSYVMAAATAIPAEAFKAEMAVKSATVPSGPVRTSQTDEMSAGNMGGENKGKTHTPEEDDAVNKNKDGGKITAEAVAAKKAEDEAKEKQEKEEAAKKAAANPGMDMSQITKALTEGIKLATAPIGDAMASLTETIKGIQKSVGDLGTKVEATAKAATEAGEIARKADATVKGALVGGATGDDPDGERVNKNESADSGRTIDTAYDRSIRKSVRSVSEQRNARRMNMG